MKFHRKKNSQYLSSTDETKQTLSHEYQFCLSVYIHLTVLLLLGDNILNESSMLDLTNVLLSRSFKNNNNDNYKSTNIPSTSNN